METGSRVEQAYRKVRLGAVCQMPADDGALSLRHEIGVLGPRVGHSDGYPRNKSRDGRGFNYVGEIRWRDDFPREQAETRRRLAGWACLSGADVLALARPDKQRQGRPLRSAD